MEEQDGILGLPRDRMVFRCDVTVDNVSTIGMLMDPLPALMDKAKRHVQRECLKRGMVQEGQIDLAAMIRTADKLNATYLCTLRQANWLEQISMAISAAVNYQPEQAGLIVTRH